MKDIFKLTIVTFLISSHWANAVAIYGEDNRVELSLGTPLQKRMGMSTATLISNDNISSHPNKSGFFKLYQETLKEKIEREFLNTVNLCSQERFATQPSPGLCSGFLIAHDLLVTAGHCSQIYNFCSAHKWIFGFEMDSLENTAGLDINQEDIYECKKVVSKFVSVEPYLDYTVVQLDRSVKNRAPLEIRTKGIIENDAPVFVIGSPSGLPLKVSDQAIVLKNNEDYFFNTNLDTFHGNSGSGVFNATTGMIEGILVRGSTDYVFNNFLLCIEANKCENDTCMGEDVLRINSIPEVASQNIMNRAARTGNLPILKNLLKLNLWIDFYTLDGQSALMKAVVAKKLNTTEALIDRGANVNLQDIDGNTSIHLLSQYFDSTSEVILKSLLKAKANLEIKNNQGDTALMVAAKSLNFPAVKVLILNGSNQNVLDSNGESVLFSFARNNQLEAVNELIAMNIDPSLKNNNGESIHRFMNLLK
jgi:hypothetical protein